MNYTRRELLSIGAAAAASAPLQGQATTEPLRIGVIGCGNRSKAHAAALKQFADAKIVAISDIRPEKTTEFNQKLAEPAATYVDYRELIRDRNVQVVIIATPGYLHHQMALEAIRAGKDVLLEKPMATNYADALEIVREAKKSGRIVAVGIQKRYALPDRQTLAVVEDGLIGNVRLINFSEFRGDWISWGWKYPDPATGKEANWRYLRKTAGSTELEFSVHAFAEVVSLVKSPLVRVAASGGVAHYTDGRDTRDVSNVLVDFANGARLDYSFTCFAPGSFSALSIVGDKGVLTRTQGKIQVQLAGRAPEPLKSSIPQSEEVIAEVGLYRQFLQNVRDRTPSPVGPEVALESSRIAYAADLSITQNRFVTDRDFA
jgi:predicted dehydrogenase